MIITKLLYFIAGVPASSWLLVAVVMGCLYLIRIKMLKSNIFKENIIQSKSVKHNVILEILQYIDNLNFLTNKIINDYELLGLYNTETVLLALKSIDRVIKSGGKIKLLNDNELENEINSYVQDTKYICSSIYNMENELYDKKKASEHLLLMYDRQYAKLNKEIDDPKTLTEIRYQFQKEIHEFKARVKSLENTYTDYRKQIHRSLMENKTKNDILQESISKYNKKEIESKKFYFKEFIYA